MNAEAIIADVSTFSRLPWHDSEFLEWNVAYGSDDEPTVTFDISFCKSDLVTGRAEIRFHGCRGFYADVDLLAKKLCGDQIASAYCEDAEKSQRAVVKQLNERFDLYQGESMSGLFVFGVTLIHPGGQFVVVARSFSLASRPED
ncbi:MAG TPA: hypothetical protein VJ276_23505 [Thermoanaerobaculia bacterium]|nr:hypothetical protein [Thermoanaerobaculia bacterium]